MQKIKHFLYRRKKIKINKGKLELRHNKRTPHKKINIVSKLYFYMPKTPLHSLRKQNQVYHNVLPNRLGNAVRIKKAVEARERYFQRLQNISLFKKLFSKTITTNINIKGRPAKYKIFQTGVKEVNLLLQESKLGSVPARMVFVLDPYGRVRFYCHLNSKHKADDYWFEVRGIKRKSIFNNCISTKEKTIHAFEETEWKNLNAALNIYEKDREYTNSITIGDILRIQRML